jgi:hypothetical protein
MKKNKNSGKKRKFSFNAVDAAIILIVIALVAFIVYFFALGKDFSDKNDDTSSDITSETVNSDTGEAISNNYDATVFCKRLENSF